MVKKVEILGMSLNSFMVQESMLQLEEYWNKTIMSTIENISMETLVKAHGDEELKNCIENLDLSVICDKEILKAAGVASRQWVQEITENKFFKEFMRRTVNGERHVYLLGETQQQVELMQDFLEKAYLNIEITGGYALSECTGDYDAVINEINIEAPDVILSVLPTPVQEYFLKEHKEKLNAKVWYGLGQYAPDKKGVSEMADFARKLLQKGIMHSILLRYHKNKGDDSDE
ncbi:MAG: glycosyltransferase [Lachnospiraceae bacterium]|nr:glycosyltransferase [Lachnospiraceae bacterium]